MRLFPATRAESEEKTGHPVRAARRPVRRQPGRPPKTHGPSANRVCQNRLFPPTKRVRLVDRTQVPSRKGLSMRISVASSCPRPAAHTAAHTPGPPRRAPSSHLHAPLITPSSPCGPTPFSLAVVTCVNLKPFSVVNKNKKQGELRGKGGGSKESKQASQHAPRQPRPPPGLQPPPPLRRRRQGVTRAPPSSPSRPPPPRRRHPRRRHRLHVTQARRGSQT